MLSQKLYFGLLYFAAFTTAPSNTLAQQNNNNNNKNNFQTKMIDKNVPHYSESYHPHHHRHNHHQKHYHEPQYYQYHKPDYLQQQQQPQIRRKTNRETGSTTFATTEATTATTTQSNRKSVEHAQWVSSSSSSSADVRKPEAQRNSFIIDPLQRFEQLVSALFYASIAICVAVLICCSAFIVCDGYVDRRHRSRHINSDAARFAQLLLLDRPQIGYIHSSGRRRNSIANLTRNQFAKP